MPDSLSYRLPETVPAPAPLPDTARPAPLPVAELIRRERRPLPAHDLEAVPFRAWAVAVCHAEVAHRSRDFHRVERTLGLVFDRWLEPDCEQLGQFQHEAHAAAALVWLSHLQTHESEKRTPWSGVPFKGWSEPERVRWFAKRRTLWSGFLRQIECYRATRLQAKA